MSNHTANAKSFAVTAVAIAVTMIIVSGIMSCSDSTDTIQLTSTSSESAKALYGTDDSQSQHDVNGRWSTTVNGKSAGYSLTTYVQGDSPTAVNTCQIDVNGKTVSKATSHGNAAAMCRVPDNK